MESNLTITEQLMYSTIRIECDLGGGAISTGTGFLFRFLETNYEAVLDSALKTGYINEEDVPVLDNWRKDPAHWEAGK